MFSNLEIMWDGLSGAVTCVLYKCVFHRIWLSLELLFALMKG